MKVSILNMTNNPIETLYIAFKTCISRIPPTEIKIPMKPNPLSSVAPDVPDYDKMIKIIKENINHSVIEHVSFTFIIEGVSRSLSHQLVRFREASYSQQSQRSVQFDQFDYVIPPEIAKNSELKKVFIKQMKDDQKTYDCLVKGLIKQGRTKKQAIEDAKYVFPNACNTNLVMTMNLKSLRNFYKECSCKKYAQWEIRELAEEIMKLVKGKLDFADYNCKKCGISCFECVKKKLIKIFEYSIYDIEEDEYLDPRYFVVNSMGDVQTIDGDILPDQNNYKIEMESNK